MTIPVDGLEKWLGYEFYLALEDTLKAFGYLQSLNKWNNDEIDRRMGRGLGVSLQDYYESEKALAELRLRNAAIIKWVIVATMSIIILVIAIYVYKFYTKQKKRWITISM